MPEKIRIGIAVHEVPDADHGLVPPSIEQRRGRGCVAERHPGDDASHLGVRARCPQHVLGVLDVVGGLDEHHLVHPDCGLVGPELVELDVSRQLRNIAEPRVLGPLRAPHVNVAVHDCARSLPAHPGSWILPDANTSSSRLIAVCRCSRIASAAASGSRLPIALAIATCSGFVAAA